VEVNGVDKFNLLKGFTFFGGERFFRVSVYYPQTSTRQNGRRMDLNFSNCIIQGAFDEDIFCSRFYWFTYFEVLHVQPL